VTALRRSRCFVAVLGVDRVRDQPGLGALQRRLVDPFDEKLPEDAVYRRLELIQCHAGSRQRIEEEARIVQGRAHILRADRRRDLLFDGQHAIEQARLTAAEYMGENFERFGFAGRAGTIGRRQIATLPDRLLDLFIIHRHRTARE
jgi:hypothetical protein